MKLNNSDRYSRQEYFSFIGKEGQKKLNNSYVVLIGCGALGSVIANNLVRAGVGKVKIVDRDFVELNNLQRQNLFDQNDVRFNLPKAVAAERKLKAVNSTVEIIAEVTDLNASNALSLIKGAEVVVDGTDNFETRFIINDACIKSNIPWVYGACIGSYGLVLPIIPGKTACIRCVFENLPPAGSSPTCDTFGIVNSIVSVIASIQSNEVIKIIIGDEKHLSTKLINIDLWTNNFNKLEVRRNASCIACGRNKFEFLKGDRTSTFTSLCGRNAVQIVPFEKIPVNFKEIALKLDSAGKIFYNKFLFKLTVNEFTITLFADGRAIIQGVNDVEKAKTIYSKYIGN